MNEALSLFLVLIWAVTCGVCIKSLPMAVIISFLGSAFICLVLL